MEKQPKAKFYYSNKDIGDLLNEAETLIKESKETLEKYEPVVLANASEETKAIVKYLKRYAQIESREVGFDQIKRDFARLKFNRMSSAVTFVFFISFLIMMLIIQ